MQIIYGFITTISFKPLKLFRKQGITLYKLVLNVIIDIDAMQHIFLKYLFDILGFGRQI